MQLCVISRISSFGKEMVLFPAGVQWVYSKARYQVSIRIVNLKNKIKSISFTFLTSLPRIVNPRKNMKFLSHIGTHANLFLVQDFNLFQLKSYKNDWRCCDRYPIDVTCWSKFGNASFSDINFLSLRINQPVNVDYASALHLHHPPANETNKKLIYSFLAFFLFVNSIDLLKSHL